MTDLNSNALTTLAEVKDQLGISGSDDDDRLKKLINVCSAYLAKRCNRVFERGTITEFLPGPGNTTLVVTRPPIESIAYVKFDGTTVDASYYESVSGDIAAGIIRHILGTWFWTAPSVQRASTTPLPGEERKLYEVQYVGGYYLPADAVNRNLPEELEEACAEMVVGRFRVRGRDPDIKSEKLLDWAATYGRSSKTAGGVSPFVDSVIEAHRRLM